MYACKCEMFLDEDLSQFVFPVLAYGCVMWYFNLRYMRVLCIVMISGCVLWARGFRSSILLSVVCGGEGWGRFFL